MMTLPPGLPPHAYENIPALVQQKKDYWPKPPTSIFAAQVEQESCISLKSTRCWNPKVENKNPKNNGEYGFGVRTNYRDQKIQYVHVIEEVGSCSLEVAMV